MIFVCNVPLQKLLTERGEIFAIITELCYQPKFFLMLSPRLLCLFLCFASTAHASDAVNYQRLGWISRSAAEKLPINERPPIKATCNGTWLTPIASSTKVAKLRQFLCLINTGDEVIPTNH